MKPNRLSPEPRTGNRKWPLLAMLLSVPTALLANGLPEPGLVMYGVVRNVGTGTPRLTTGTLIWTITPTAGSSITITNGLSDIGGQFSYLAWVPFESIVGSATPSPNVLQLQSAVTTYWR